MAKLFPFRAVLPHSDWAANVPSRSVLTYDLKRRKAILNSNPRSFLHVLFPGYQKGVRLRGHTRFKAIRKAYEEFMHKGVFTRQPESAYYLYEIEDGEMRCCGLIAGVSSADYENGVIKRHEDTIEKRVDLFKDYLLSVRFNAEPVLLTHAPIPRWNALMQEIRKENPTLEIQYGQGEKHSVWSITDTKWLKTIREIFDPEPIYIADGHHRSASSAKLSHDLAQKNRHHTGKEPYNYFLGYLIPESDIRISEFNRVIRDLHGLSAEELISALRTDYEVEPCDYPKSVKKKYEFGMYLNGSWYLLKYKNIPADDAAPLRKLDAQILYTTIIRPILGITDLRTDTRIQYLFGENNLLKMKDLIDREEFAVGFGLAPAGVDEMMSIADAGAIMPPKSTYIEPKLLSGLTIYEY